MAKRLFLTSDLEVLALFPLKYLPNEAFNSEHKLIKKWSVWRRDEYKCWLCGQQVVNTRTRDRSWHTIVSNKFSKNSGKSEASGPDFLTLDHVVPVIFGGTDSTDNLKTACHSCNSCRSCFISENDLGRFNSQQLRNVIHVAVNSGERLLKNHGFVTAKPEVATALQKDLAFLQDESHSVWDRVLFVLNSPGSYWTSLKKQTTKPE
jgi:hypothetical protein